VFSWIDVNGDGRISPAEADAYGREMLRSVVLSVDDRPADATLVDIFVPPLPEMSLGLGTIRIRARAENVPAGWGTHHLSYLNMHRSETSVYLVNVLVPSDPRIEIGAQRRDSAQHELALDYRVMPIRSWDSICSLFVGLVMAGALSITRRRR
jgi:hypothetical protein